MKTHHYDVRITWTGNDGEGTKSYRAYRRDHTIDATGRPTIPASSDPSFRGDPARYNPEQLLVAGVSSCHMLWYLHLCAVNQISVIDYVDDAIGTMEEDGDGSGQFVHVVLRPSIKIAAGGDVVRAHALHEEAHHLCFIARSVNFPVSTEPTITASPVSPS
ncbi:MAG: OsmC family protein [Opitutus sp.]